MILSEAYRVLDVTSSATKDEIKKAYRILLSKHHPDKNNGSKESEEKMKKINEAYMLLTDPNRKDVPDFWGSTSNSREYGGFYSSSVFDEFFADFVKKKSREYTDPFSEDFFNKYQQTYGGKQKTKNRDFVKSTYQTYPTTIDVNLSTFYKYKDYIPVVITVTHTKHYSSGKCEKEQSNFNYKLTPREFLNGIFHFHQNEIQINIIKDNNITIDKETGNITIDVIVNFIDAYYGTSKEMSLPDGRLIALKIPQNTATNTLMKLPLYGIFSYSQTYVRILVDIIQTTDTDFLNIMNMLKDMHVYKSQK